MSYSDDEDEELVPKVVSDYSFFDHNNEPICFSELSLIWDDGERLEGSKKVISLRGTTDNGLQQIFEQVVAWKFDSSSAKPEIFVLSKKKNWIKLLKPRKIFENIVRSILITVHCLNFLKRNPKTSEKALWDHLTKVFSLYEPRPSQNDLVDHMNLIGKAVNRDEALARSKLLVAFLQEMPQKNKVSYKAVGTEAMSNFIDDEVAEEKGEDGSDEEDKDGDCFESVCAICDNGGNLLCCEGKCMRSFHADEEAGSDSGCETLGFSEEQVEAIATFECKNCQYKQHQCFICGKLGSSDKIAGAEVFQCVTGTCGYFYHPHCVAAVLCSRYGDETKELEGKIAAGEPFMCPLHKCHACKELEPEDNGDRQMQFAVCRRCPRAYHRKCLPRKIAFEDDVDVNTVQRAWENLIPNKILIYCLKHEIDEDLLTPTRDHLKFPDTDEKKKNETPKSVARDKSLPKERVDASEDATGKKLSLPKERVDASADATGKKLSSPKERVAASEVATGKKLLTKQSQRTDKLSAAKSPADSSTWNERLSVTKTLRKQKLKDDSKAALKETLAGKKDKMSVKSMTPLGDQLYYALCRKDSEPKVEISDPNQQITGVPGAKEVDNSLILDADSKKRILSIIEEAESSIKLEDVICKHQSPSTKASSSKRAVKNITLGKLEGLTEALRVALQKLDAGGSLEDAKAVCHPHHLLNITKWKTKLKVFLAPFLYGQRYTSFGRHFTKVEKLKLIVDRLHFYVQDSDMIVDFCCGSNDFSCLMKEKLDQMGKNCRYKNYDIFPPKNDFNFEKRDWFTVCANELPPGAELIMGLNPPFGTNANLANQFIEKALEFKPKLLIIIAPRETLRLDERKNNPYNLVWEDKELLRDKAFYLPGSVDAHGKQMEDWNANPPQLSLWSHPDWTEKHKAIALKNGHLSTAQEGLYERDAPDCKPETHNLDYEAPMVADGLQDVQQQHEGDKVTENGTQSFPRGSGVKESHMAHDCSKDQGNDTYEEVNKNNRKRRREWDEKSSERRSLPRHSSPSISGSRSQGNHLSSERRSLPRHSSPNISGSRSRRNNLSKHPEMHSHADIRREGHQNFDHIYGSEPQERLQRGHGSYHGDGTGMRNIYSEESYSNMQERRALHSVHGSDYGLMVADEQFPAYRGECASVNGYGREADTRARVQMYGYQDPVSFSHRNDTYSTNPPSVYPSSYSQLGPAVGPVYDSMNSSAMQRYAPRLDELNHTRMNNMASMQPYSGRSGMYSPAPHPQHQPSSYSTVSHPQHQPSSYSTVSHPQHQPSSYSTVSHPQHQASSLGFASGQYRPYSQQNSSGWINE